MKINIFPTPEEVLTQLADYFILSANESISKKGRFSVALSGGSSPKKLYELLASPSMAGKIPWQKVYFFFGDERYVPATDPGSNYLMAKKALLDPLNIEDLQVAAVNTTLPPAAAARNYGELIIRHFGNNKPEFDLVLLGLGDNSHTASLFPDTPVLHDTEPAVKEVFLEDQQVYRITLNAPLINMAGRIAFLVYGVGKAEAVHHVIEDNKDIDQFPAQLISPADGDLQWFLDSAAASKLHGGHL